MEEVPELGVKSKQQLQAYNTATSDLSSIRKLYHTLQQCQILNPWSKARDQTCNLTETTLGP